MLEKILGTSGKISLLRALLASRERYFSINELAAISGLSASTAFKEIKDLLETVVDYDPLTKKYRAKKTPLTEALEEIFRLEKKLFGAAGATIFDFLSGLGSYYISGTPAIALRGLSPDFTASTDSLMIVCDRRVSKLRGAIMSLFPQYRLLLVEEQIMPADFVEGEVYFGGAMTMTNLAVLEKAVADALWMSKWEGENIAYAIYCFLEQPLDMELLKKYAKEKGPKVEGRLRRVMELASHATGRSYKLDDLRASGKIEKTLELNIEEALERVLRS
ncbi:MAG: hypothetical protein ACK4GQ_02650 [Candidatus Hadarchaeales archaeon]